MIVGTLQFNPVRHDVAANIAKVQQLLKGTRADLVVLPELANSGYMYASPGDLEPHSEMADGRGPFLTALRSLAGKMNGMIITGLAERTGRGLFNSAVAVGARGVIACYRKTHLFYEEQDLFLSGDSGFAVFEHESARIGMMICFDWYFPESARTLALLGAQIIAHPSNLVLPHCQTAMVTRCLENRVFAITTNRYGTETLGEKSLTFTGASQLMSPTGIRLLQAPVEGECLLLAEIDPMAADDKQVTTRNHVLSDRRPEMYVLSR